MKNLLLSLALSLPLISFAGDHNTGDYVGDNFCANDSQSIVATVINAYAEQNGNKQLEQYAQSLDQNDTSSLSESQIREDLSSVGLTAVEIEKIINDISIASSQN